MASSARPGGNQDFQEHTKKTLERLDSKPCVWDNLEFLGVSVSTIPGEVGRFTPDQMDYVYHLLPLPGRAPFESFVRTRARFEWLAHSWQDLCCAANRAAQDTERTYNDRHVTELNTSMRYGSQTEHITLRVTGTQHAPPTRVPRRVISDE